ARDHPPVARIGAASDRSRMRAAATVRGSQATGLCRGKYGSMSTATPQRPGLQAHSQATRLPTAELVSELRALLGAKLVAYLGGVRETRAVRQWADGQRAVQDKTTEYRLRSEEHTSELQSRFDLVCRLLLEKKNNT